MPDKTAVRYADRSETTPHIHILARPAVVLVTRRKSHILSILVTLASGVVARNGTVTDCRCIFLCCGAKNENQWSQRFNVLLFHIIGAIRRSLISGCP
jgi:hypothetical protein